MKSIFLPALAVVVITGMLFVDPVPQDPAYHDFADGHAAFGVANFWNVISNIPFLLVGGAGLWWLRDRSRVVILDNLYAAYLIFFAGVSLTAFGSAWYHLDPGNQTLVWDRLPMTLAFMGLFTIVSGEQVSETAARRMLLPLLILGVASVFYWSLTEARGAGDLRFYAVVQFLPMLLIPLMLVIYRSPFDRNGFYWGMIGLYAASKALEFLDGEIYALGRLLSGHSIKHIVAALAPLLFLYGIVKRRRLPENSGSAHSH